MTEPLNHKLDISKIKTIKDVKNIFECMCLSSNASETHEKYELIKEYFTIPNEPQELKLDWSTEFRIGKDEVGYWDIKPNIKVYLKKKPNRVVRYFTKLLLDFTWKDV